jgi:hypothetical protein
MNNPYAEIREKIHNYLLSRKTEITLTDLALRFGRSESYLRKVLSLMREEGSVVKIESRKSMWKISNEIKKETKEIPRPVAVPREITQVRPPPAHNRPIQNSYPAIRGYDD